LRLPARDGSAALVLIEIFAKRDADGHPVFLLRAPRTHRLRRKLPLFASRRSMQAAIDQYVGSDCVGANAVVGYGVASGAGIAAAIELVGANAVDVSPGMYPIGPYCGAQPPGPHGEAGAMPNPL
jgi:hypothetical protein